MKINLSKLLIFLLGTVTAGLSHAADKQTIQHVADMLSQEEKNTFERQKALQSTQETQKKPDQTSAGVSNVEETLMSQEPPAPEPVKISPEELQRLQDIDNMIDQQRYLEYQSMLTPPPSASDEKNLEFSPAFSTTSSEETPATEIQGQSISPNAALLALLTPFMLSSTPTPAEMARSAEQAVPHEAMQAYLYNIQDFRK